MSLAIESFEESPREAVAADLRALGHRLSVGGIDAVDPVEAGSVELPGAEVLGELDLPEELGAPARVDEFVCASCVLVVHRSRQVAPGVCRDCGD
ncbi:MAG: DUF4193 family protein [Gaiellales bacterium]